jgi:hypothetical protein
MPQQSSLKPAVARAYSFPHPNPLSRKSETERTFRRHAAWGKIVRMSEDAGKCPMCGNQIPVNTRSCLECGELFPDSLAATPARKWFANIIAIVLFIGFLSLISTPYVGSHRPSRFQLSGGNIVILGWISAFAVFGVWPVVRFVIRQGRWAIYLATALAIGCAFAGSAYLAFC